MLYRLKSGRHSRIEGKDKDGAPIRKLYRPICPENPEGDLIDLTRAEALKFGDRVVPHVPHVDEPVMDEEVLAAAAEPEPDVDLAPDAPADAPSEWATISEMTVGDVEEMIASIDSAADLRDIYSVEEQTTRPQGPRVGVLNAIRYRLAALQEEAAEAGERNADAAEE